MRFFERSLKGSMEIFEKNRFPKQKGPLASLPKIRIDTLDEL